MKYLQKNIFCLLKDLAASRQTNCNAFLVHCWQENKTKNLFMQALDQWQTLTKNNKKVGF